jgi:hypothetical protein
MGENIFDQLRSKIEEDKTKDGRTGAGQGSGSEEEMRQQLQRIQFFRVHVFPTVRDFMRTVIALQREKIRGAGMDNIIHIEYPLTSAPETRYGFALPVKTSKNPQTQIENAMLTASVPGKPARHYMWVFHINSVESKISVEFFVYDELARLAGSLEPDEAHVDSDSEFKEGEMLITIKSLVDKAIERCVRDIA